MLGGHNLNNRDAKSFAMIPIKKWIIHPRATDFTKGHARGHWDVDKSQIIYDYSIIVLHSEVMLTKHIQPICLPPKLPIISTMDHYDGHVVYASGWGFTKLERYGNQGKYNITTASYFPKRVSLKIVHITECEQKYTARTNIGSAFQSTDRKLAMLCARGGKYNSSFLEDVSKGDSGGTLTFKCIIILLCFHTLL